MIRSSHWKLLLVLFSIIATCAYGQPAPGGQGGFFSAWWGAKFGDPYEQLSPTAYWYPSKTQSNADRIGGITATNTSNLATISTNGWEFNGSSQYLDMGRPTSIEIGTSKLYSMSAWVRPSTTNNVTGGIMGKAFVAGGDRWIFFHATQSGGRQWFFIVDEGVITGPAALDPVFPISSNTWYHLTLVIDRPTSNGIKAYIDGVQYAQGTFNNTNAITYNGNTDVPFRFGSYNTVGGAPGNYFNGWIDRAAVWNGRALTSNDVFNLFNNTKTGRK